MAADSEPNSVARRVDIVGTLDEKDINGWQLPGSPQHIDKATGQRHGHSVLSNEESASNDQGLPRADGGLAAWRFLFAAFMMEAFQWGECQRHVVKGSRH